MTLLTSQTSEGSGSPPDADTPTAGSSSSLGPVPSGQLSSRARVSGIARESQASAARRDRDNNRLHITADSMRLSVNHRYKHFQAPIVTFEWDMHDLWHTYYLASKHISAQHPAQDRLALQLIALKGQGVLNRPNPKKESATTAIEVEEAMTANGRIWADLPFLVGDMTQYWITDFPKMSAAQRLNFAQFLAKLAKVSLIAEDDLCGIGLVVLRDALETTRPLGQMQLEEGAVIHAIDEEDVLRRAHDISIAGLLPSANAWLFEAGAKLIQLSDQNWNNCTTASGIAGEPIGMHAPGFSSQRWLYWLRRLEEIANAAASHSPDLSDYAAKMVGNMLAAVEEADDASLVKRAVRENRSATDKRNHAHIQLLGAPGHG
ncbi:hypothetical protein BKA67DRAFT_584804 [Truncatella angustata]|uniref:Uncharacterized protein n=1 Tax=Truncatella angustata TaxID=152316 RepID=A0A9P8UAZ3_9PEZI|nr:uncharacterized protein BKA67DRAFT_584804 [Truncatella angustata]KAH6645332.1 hypothetical protein BKA67DRAFT_584804 [Truncatella angustata]KAH8203303.1 hypothetical protein TruAng_002499 [Truncatella angustata]